MTTEGVALTPKQRKVFDLLTQGVSVADIARRLRISQSGVYGHIRNIRSAGVTLPEEAAPAAAPPAAAPTGGHPVVPTISTNGSPVTPEDAVRTALQADEARMQAIDAEVTELQERVGALGTERQQLEERLGKYNAALEALA